MKSKANGTDSASATEPANICDLEWYKHLFSSVILSSNRNMKVETLHGRTKTEQKIGIAKNYREHRRKMRKLEQPGGGSR